VIVPVNELASPRAGWFEWGASVLASKSSWLTGNKVDFKKTDFVHIPTLKVSSFIRIYFKFILGTSK
jgi:hypothetical protein